MRPTAATSVALLASIQMEPPGGKTILKLIRETLDQIPPELSGDIYDRGIALCGGSALLRNLDRLIQQETQLPVQIVAEPLAAVVIGAGKMLADKDLLKRLAVN